VGSMFKGIDWYPLNNDNFKYGFYWFLGVTSTSALSFFGNSIEKKIQTSSLDDGDYRLTKIFKNNFQYLI
jgi:hypothetical protein